jgi:branched-chain amino acid transport system substrate-binding protein
VRRSADRLAVIGGAVSALLMATAGPSWADVLAAGDDGHASRAWIWAVLGGLALAGFLLFHVISSALNALPEEVRAPVIGSVKANARPLIAGGVVLLWTLVFTLYSVSSPSSGDTLTQASDAGVSTEAGTATTTGSTGTTTAPATKSGRTAAVTGGTVSAPQTATGNAGGAGTAVKPAVAGPTYSFGGTNKAGTSSHANSVHLYSGAADTIGMTANKVTLCGHASLIFGKAVNARPEDLVVFWKYLNDKGGIAGRKFDVSLEDDQYDGAKAVQAAQRCKEKNPFLVFGGVGSDLIPAVRTWAEANKQLYFYSFAAHTGSENLKYSYTETVSQERISTVMGEMAAKKHPGKKVGIIWRNSANFQPGHDAYKKAVQAGGSTLVADVQVTKNQGSYGQEILTLQQKGAEVVFVLEDAVSQINIIKQGKAQQYNPVWQVFPFNLQTSTLGDDALNPPMEGVNLSPAYQYKTYTGPFASYASEMKEFEAAYAKYDPDADLSSPTGDLLWLVWVTFKQLAATFDACGRDCGRNAWMSLFHNGYHGTVGAACPVDHRQDPHHGQKTVDVYEAYRAANGAAAWKTTRRCVHDF